MFPLDYVRLLLEGILPKCSCVLSSPSHQEPMMSPYRIGDVNFDHLIKADLSAFFSVKLQFSPL